MTYSRDDGLEDLYYAKRMFETRNWECDYADDSCHGKLGDYPDDMFLCEYHGSEYVRARTREYVRHFKVDS